MSARSMQINLRSWVPEVEARFGRPAASDGSLPAASPARAACGKFMSVRVDNPSGGCAGSFGIDTPVASFNVFYRHPSGPGATTVQVTAPPGYLAATDGETFPGHEAIANLNLYRGVPAHPGWAVPLGLLAERVRDNCGDFVNSMYGPDMRALAVVQAASGRAASDGIVPPADFTGGQMAGFVALWAKQWLNGKERACPAKDAVLLRLLANYVRTASSAGPLVMWVPQIVARPGTSPVAYDLSGYRAFPFQHDGAWVGASVEAFLGLLAGGAHMVAVSAPRDLPAGVTATPFDRHFEQARLDGRAHPGNSHYAGIMNTTGRYYLDIDEDFAPVGAGLLQAFLVGRTVNGGRPAHDDYNSFLQLEGWQARFPLSARHKADYDAHEKTLWNVSTFGASPYSEKRGTTVFLAPPGWRPQPYQVTRMMPYVGAYAHGGRPQPWLKTGLIHIDSSAPPLPSRYDG